ncbi:MAG: (2Fe-2S)-binding protein [Planctomycetes bacterium]|nr:(2Fe-2S)-binding protein [Planctomycetota bacterium]
MPDAGDNLRVTIDGTQIHVPPRTTVAAACVMARATRRSVAGEPRTALCGMGVCFECRATVDGRLDVRTCMLHCRDGMEVHTGG